jgi:hypothetical protein
MLVPQCCIRIGGQNLSKKGRLVIKKRVVVCRLKVKNKFKWQ